MTVHSSRRRFRLIVAIALIGAGIVLWSPKRTPPAPIAAINPPAEVEIHYVDKPRSRPAPVAGDKVVQADGTPVDDGEAMDAAEETFEQALRSIERTNTRELIHEITDHGETTVWLTSPPTEAQMQSVTELWHTITEAPEYTVEAKQELNASFQELVNAYLDFKGRKFRVLTVSAPTPPEPTAFHVGYSDSEDVVATPEPDQPEEGLQVRADQMEGTTTWMADDPYFDRYSYLFTP